MKIIKLRVGKSKKTKGKFVKQESKTLKENLNKTLNKIAKKLGINQQQQETFKRDVADANKIKTNKQLKKLKQQTNKLNNNTKYKTATKKLNLPKNHGLKNEKDANKSIKELQDTIFQNQDEFYQENRDLIMKMNELRKKNDIHWKQERQLEDIEEGLRQQYGEYVDKKDQQQAIDVSNKAFRK